MSWRKKLTESEIAELMQRLAELTGKPGPLADGLISAAQNTSSLPVRKAMQGLAQQLSKGGDVAQGLEKRGLPLYLIGLVHAGTQTGRLPVILSALSRYYRRRRQWKRRIWLSLAYPMFVFAFLGVIATIVFGSLVPAFGEIFYEFDTEIPATTKSMIWISETGWMYATGLLVALVVALLGLFAFGGRIAILRLLYNVPGFGKLFHWDGIIEFLKLLQLLLQVETPLPQALRLTAGAVRSASVSDFASYVAERVEQGTQFGRVLEADLDVPGGIQPVLSWGEQTNRLPDAIETAMEILEGRMQLRTRLVNSVFPPLMFVCAGGFAIALVFTMFLPLLSLIQNLTM